MFYRGAGAWNIDQIYPGLVCPVLVNTAQYKHRDGRCVCEVMETLILCSSKSCLTTQVNIVDAKTDVLLIQGGRRLEPSVAWHSPVGYS